MAPRDPPPDDGGIDLSAFDPEALAEESDRRAHDRTAKRRRARWVVVDGGRDGDDPSPVAPPDGSGRTRGE